MAKKYGKYTPEQFRKNLESFEAIAGSQKKAAEKLGVNVSTYRAWKTGQRDPSKEKTSAFNRIFGQNKRKLEETEVRSRLEKRQKTTETKRKAREPQRRKESVKIEGTYGWVKAHFDEGFIIQAISTVAPEYVAYNKGDDDRVQFLSPFELDRIGKPPRIKTVKLYGLYSNNYVFEKLLSEGEDVPESKTDFFASSFGVMDGYLDTWDLETMLNYMERKFFDTIKQEGRRRWNPVRFIGYQLL